MEDYKKKYEDALERAREMCAMPTDKATMEYVFPELKESEDERIRKSLLNEFTHLLSKGCNKFAGLENEDIITWLEKQGEQKPFDYEHATIIQKDFAPKDYHDIDPHFGISVEDLMSKEKPADNVEPKFKVGDWICNNSHSYLIAYIDLEQRRYLFEIGGYTHEQLNWEYIENADSKYHLWSIQDAKDGDVLYSIDSKQPFIYKERPQFSQARGYCCINQFGEFAIWDTNQCVICTDKYIPATKKQYDTLMKAMTEAGYTFDFEKKELSHKEVTKKSDKDGKKWIDEKVY